MKVSVFLLLLLGICQHGFGQTEGLYHPKLAIKVNPLAFVAYTPGIEVGVEHTISPNSSIHLAGSYLSDFGIFNNRNFEGYKAIGEYRIYNLFNDDTDNGYTSFQFHLKKAFAEGTTYVDRANGSYQELYDFSLVNTSLDFLAANGIVFPVGRVVSFDASILYGAKQLSLSDENLPEDATFRLREEFFSFELEEFGSEWFPVFRLQLKLNVVLK